MTAWNIIPDSDIDAESPITESLMFRLRDNVKALAENDASVPDAELQLAEGMRTNMPDGNVIVSQGGKMVAGGVSENSSSMQYATGGVNAHITIATGLSVGEYIVSSVGYIRQYVSGAIGDIPRPVAIQARVVDGVAANQTTVVDTYDEESVDIQTNLLYMSGGSLIVNSTNPYNYGGAYSSIIIRIK